MKKWQVNKCKYLSSEKYEIDIESPYDFKQLHSNVFLKQKNIILFFFIFSWRNANLEIRREKIYSWERDWDSCNKAEWHFSVLHYFR